MEIKPHTLLKISSVEELVADFSFPEWVALALSNAPYVVVRRAEFRDGLIPVGVRGPQRAERWACWLPERFVVEVISPFSLIDEANWKAVYTDLLPETVKALRHIAPSMKDTGFQWGPTGSTGFELATGFPTVKESSDLDLMIEVPEILAVKTAKILLDSMEHLSPVRLDIQLNSPLGGFSLKEFANSATVLVKTNSGPIIMDAGSLWD